MLKHFIWYKCYFNGCLSLLAINHSNKETFPSRKLAGFSHNLLMIDQNRFLRLRQPTSAPSSAGTAASARTSRGRSVQPARASPSGSSRTPASPETDSGWSGSSTDAAESSGTNRPDGFRRQIIQTFIRVIFSTCPIYALLSAYMCMPHTPIDGLARIFCLTPMLRT